jgi:multimeric flavodoxin WrbA
MADILIPHHSLYGHIERMAPWVSGALVGKVGSVFTSSASQHGGQESTILTFHPTLFHLGMARSQPGTTPRPVRRAGRIDQGRHMTVGWLNAPGRAASRPYVAGDDKTPGACD